MVMRRPELTWSAYEPVFSGPRPAVTEDGSTVMIVPGVPAGTSARPARVTGLAGGGTSGRLISLVLVSRAGTRSTAWSITQDRPTHTGASTAMTMANWKGNANWDNHRSV